MALRPSFPGPTGVTSTLDGRRDFAGLVVRDTAGNPRPGIFARNATSIVSVVAATWTLSVGGYEGVLVRDGVLLTANDGATTTPANTSQAPASNSRIDVLYAKQNENANGYADGATTPIFGWVYGTPSATPAKPSLSSVPGAIEIATAQIPSGSTSLSSGGVVITPTYQYTALSGAVLPVRTIAERDALTLVQDGQLVGVFATEQMFQWLATATTPHWQLVAGKAEVGTITLNPAFKTNTGSLTPQVTRANGRCYVDGAANILTNPTTIPAGNISFGTVQAGYRPATTVIAPMRFGTAFGIITINTDGTMVFQTGATGSYATDAIPMGMSGVSWQDARL